MVFLCNEKPLQWRSLSNHPRKYSFTLVQLKCFPFVCLTWEHEDDKISDHHYTLLGLPPCLGRRVCALLLVSTWKGHVLKFLFVSAPILDATVSHTNLTTSLSIAGFFCIFYNFKFEIGVIFLSFLHYYRGGRRDYQHQYHLEDRRLRDFRSQWNKIIIFVTEL